jgi:RNA polymerase sigma-70 factor (ECF subfamily)
MLIAPLFLCDLFFKIVSRSPNRPNSKCTYFITKLSTIELKEIIQNCIQGKRVAQNQLYQHFASKMFTVCLRYANSREEAKDLLQEGFIKVFECLHQFKFEGPFEGWMRKVIVNIALQKIRSKSHLHAIVPIEAGSEAESINQQEILSHLGAKELLALIQDLPNSYRLVFNLYVFEGMKHKEISKLLNISEGTSKSNLHDARIILQKKLKDSLHLPDKLVANE